LEETNEIHTFRIRIAIKGTRPLVWRLLEVPSNITFDAFHHVLQLVFGWSNSEDFEFNAHGYTICNHAHHERMTIIAASEVLLSEVLHQRLDKMHYTYNLFSSWLYVLRLDEIVPYKGNQVICIEGKNACPIEDIGGVFGHNHLISAYLSDSLAMRRQLEWIDEAYRPFAFNVMETNSRLELLDEYIANWQSFFKKLQK